MAPRLFLLDGTALAYRSHFAFNAARAGGLSTKDGRPTGATYGFVMTLRALLEREKPHFVGVAFDGPREALHRTALYPGYKSTREKAPEEMVSQFPDIREAAEAHGLTLVEEPGHEADDVIGTLATKAAAEGMEVFLVTGDKDFAQLVDDRIRFYEIRQGVADPEILDRAGIQAQFGVPPERIVDKLALMGDASDNVPGARGVGDKTATELLQRYGTLEEVLAHAEEVQRKNVREGLLAHRAMASLSKRLVTIERDVPMALSPRDLVVRPPDAERLVRLFTRLEFRGLLAKVTQNAPATAAVRYRIVRTPADLEELLAGLRGAGAFALDTETTGLDPRRARIVGLSFAWRDAEAWYVPLNLLPPILPGGRAAVLAALRPLLEDPALRKVGQNMKYDLAVLSTEGIAVQGLWFDTMLASYCIAPGLRPHNLDALALEYFGHKKIPTSDLIGTGRSQITMDQVPVEQVGQYACEDADFTWRLQPRLLAELDQKQVRQVFAEIEMPLLAVLDRMERAGITLDVEHLRRYSAELDRRIEQLTRSIHEAAGEAFNINSPQQLGAVLFDKLELHKQLGVRVKKTRTGQFSTDAAVLEKLAGHPIGNQVLEYRHLVKLKGTYVDSLPAMVHPDTGRIHTSFNQAVAATGRLSCDEPNLQNIPIRTPEGREVRKAFVARDRDHRLVSADYSQIELRILAHFSGDKALIEAFQRNEDIHRRTAALVFGMMPELVTKELRDRAKVINYGLVYGMGPQRLANETGISMAEARQFIDAYFRALPGVKRYLDESLARARREQVAVTLFGRRRPLPDIHAESPMVRVNAENMAVNTPIQGTAADLIKRAMIHIDRQLGQGRLRAQMLLQVHDELVFECPAEEVEPLSALVRTEMEGAAELLVPLTVEIGVGQSWLDAH